MRKIYSVMGIAVALMCGVALAESESVSTPPSGDFTMTATVTHDTSGGGISLRGGHSNIEDIEWSIDFGTDFMMSCNGSSTSYAPGTTYTVTVVVSQNAAGDWIADTTVVDDSTNQTVFTNNGHVMSQRPESAHATANSVDALSCD